MHRAWPGSKLIIAEGDGHGGDARRPLNRVASGQADQQVQVERLISLGAQRVDGDYPDEADFVVLADPDGNLFCVIAQAFERGVRNSSARPRTSRQMSNSTGFRLARLAEAARGKEGQSDC